MTAERGWESPSDRRRPSADLSLSGRLLPYLWLIVGIDLVMAGAAGVDGGRWFLLGPGLACLAVTAGIWRVDWSRMPTGFVRSLPIAGVVLLMVVGAGAPHADRALQTAERARGEASAAELAERTRLQQQVAEQTAGLAESSAEVRLQTTSVAVAAEQMAQALAQLTRTAQVADSITSGVAAKATEASVQAQVASAVDGVSEITSSRGDLSAHNGALSRAIEEQSSTVAQVSESVHQTADEGGAMADGIQTLETLSPVG